MANDTPLSSNFVARLREIANDLDQGILGYPTHAISPRAEVCAAIRGAADEIEHLDERIEVQRGVILNHVEESRELRAEIERLRAALRRYGQHDKENDCIAGCLCGLDAALEAAPPAETTKPVFDLGPTTDGWQHTHNDNEVPCHSRVIGGVLCRWWGDVEPAGVHLIDRAAIETKAATESHK